MSTKKKAAEDKEIKQKLKIKLKSYDHKLIDSSCRQIIEMAQRAQVQVTGPVPLPTNIYKYTVNRASFIHKDSRDQFEMRMHKRLIEIVGPNQKFITNLQDLNLPTGVEIEIRT